MDTLKATDPDSRKVRRPQAAFSLVEVTIAIGIVAFAFISVLGLIPTGLNDSRQAIDATVGSQIMQRVVNEAQQTDFDQLIKDYAGITISGTTAGVKYARFFDDQGAEVIPVSQAMPPTLSSSEKSRIIYWVNTRIMAATVTPYTDSVQPVEASNTNLATITVQIVNNPGNQDLNLDSTTKLWTNAPFRIGTYSCLVARSK